MQGMMKVKEKVCSFWTKHIFTCGHTATSRGEGTNSRLKGHYGCLKKLLSKSDLDQSIDRVLSLVNEQENVSLKEIKELISTEKDWSSYVQKKWAENDHKTSTMFAREDKELNDPVTWKFNVYLKGKTQKFSDVNIPRVPGAFIPSCSCGEFQSLRIPCSCICTVLNHQDVLDGVFKEHNLHYRWRLKSHPLYDKAISDLGITVQDNYEANDNEASTKTNDQIFAYDHSNYVAVKFLSSESARYTVLKERFEKTARLAKSNKENYKKMVLWMNAMYNYFNLPDSEISMYPLGLKEPEATSQVKENCIPTSHPVNQVIENYVLVPPSQPVNEVKENYIPSSQPVNGNCVLLPPSHLVNQVIEINENCVLVPPSQSKRSQMVLQQINGNCILPPHYKAERKRGRIVDSLVKNLAKHTTKKKK